ncbi:hypothetical protein [[Actinomadura] parvosata]|uniref:hypothetical protein n=1 Tax=[Actinomadura] parvosata TaxID=1955412 RepID=UPI001646BFC6
MRGVPGGEKAGHPGGKQQVLRRLGRRGYLAGEHLHTVEFPLGVFDIAGAAIQLGQRAKELDLHQHRSRTQVMTKVDQEGLTVLVVGGTGVTCFLGTRRLSSPGRRSLDDGCTRTWVHMDEHGWRFLATHASLGESAMRSTTRGRTDRCPWSVAVVITCPLCRACLNPAR